MASDTAQTRRTSQGDAIEVATVRSFIRWVLQHDAVADEVHELLFDHVIEGRYQRSTVAATLQRMPGDVLAATTREDWLVITAELVSDARDVLGDECAPRRARWPYRLARRLLART